MQHIHHHAGRFLLCYGLTFSLLAASLLLLSWVYLNRIGELNLDEVVEMQANDQFCLFGSGIEQDNYTYKLALYDRIRPDIAIIGSSRVMQFRGRYFQGSFANLGGASSSTVALKKFVTAMLEMGRAPKLVILGLDFWWFNPVYAGNENNFIPQEDAYSISFDHLKTPLYWLLEGKVTYQDIKQALLVDEDGCRLGVMARKLSDGFGPDGSYYYTSLISGRKMPATPGFQDELSRIADGRDRFEWSASVSREDVQRVVETVRELEAAGGDVILFMPPLAAPVYRAILDSGDRYKFLEQLPVELQRAGLQVHDYTDPATISSKDCEFVDGFHGGEITYVRLLHMMAQNEAKLKAHVHHDKMLSTTSKWSGFAMVANRRVTNDPETDFLRFGCAKRVPESTTFASRRQQQSGQSHGR